jgi:hypothetical protein
LYDLAEDVHIHYHILGGEYPEENRIARLLGWIAEGKREGATHLELIETFDLSENQAELILFYAEQNGIIADLQPSRSGFHFKLQQAHTPESIKRISQRIQSAKGSKLRKLQQMTAWLSSQDCLRQGLLRYFEELEKQEQIQRCCSVCGFDRTIYESQRQLTASSAVSMWDLDAALRMLLPVYRHGKEEGNSNG